MMASPVMNSTRSLLPILPLMLPPFMVLIAVILITDGIGRIFWKRSYVYGFLKALEEDSRKK